MWECDTYFEMDVGVLDLTIIYSWLIAFSFIVSLIEAPLEAKWELRRRVIQVIVFKKIKSLELLPIGDRRLTDWKGMMRRSVVCSVRISWIFIWNLFHCARPVWQKHDTNWYNLWSMESRHDSAPQTREQLQKFKCTLSPSTSYSADLAFSDFNIFSYLWPL